MNDASKKSGEGLLFNGISADILNDDPSVFGVHSENASDFKFDSYARTLSRLIASKKNRTPLVIGIYGSWGSGKTTLMREVEKNLARFPGKQKEKFRVCKTVWFQPWKLNSEEEILAGLLEAILKAMDGGTVRDKVFKQLETVVKTVAGSKVIGATLEGTLGIGAFFGKLSHKEKLGFYNVFEEYFSDLIWAFTRNKIKGSKNTKFEDDKGVVVVFIDDLDRCEEGKILKVLETIKLFVNQPGCVVVLGVARDVLKVALQKKGFAEENYAEEYMQKIVQVTFDLPSKNTEAIKDYMLALEPDESLLHEHSALIARALKFNPRGVKRFLNDLSLMRSLFSDLETNIEEKTLNKALLVWAILGITFNEFTTYVRQNAKAFDGIQKTLNALGQREHWRLKDEEIKEVDERLHTLIKNRDFADLIREFPVDTGGELKRLIIECSSVVDSSKKVSPGKHESGLNHEAVVVIPAGNYEYKDGEKNRTILIEKHFKIDVYPVTNLRFSNFVADKGYEREDLWEDGWEWCKNNDITQPEYWNDSELNQPEQPVVGVSWYEARAFARWEGKRLPTVDEWEVAARGREGREYPWGDAFDSGKCNSEESEIDKATPVNKYPEGRSEWGCYDMVGNVWEWTEDGYGEKDKVLCGGSWVILPENLCPANFVRAYPSGRSVDFGFRCCQ